MAEREGEPSRESTLLRGIGLLIIGAGLALVIVGQYVSAEADAWLGHWLGLETATKRLFEELSTGAIVAGVILVCVEPMTHRRREREIRRVSEELKTEISATVNGVKDELQKQTDVASESQKEQLELLKRAIQGDIKAVIDRQSEQLKDTVSHIESTLQSRIRELTEVETEALVRRLMPAPGVFNAIKTHIIRQPFVRERQIVSIDLQPHPDDPRYVVKRLRASYEVENVAQTEETYEVYLFEEKVNEDRFPGSTKLISVQIESLDRSLLTTFAPPQSKWKSQEAWRVPELLYEGPDLEVYTTSTGPDVSARIPIRLSPGQKAKVSVGMESTLQTDYVYPFVVSTATNGMDVVVVHHQSLEVKGIPLFPSRGELKSESPSGGASKHWHVRDALLPYQGVQVTWRPSKAFAARIQLQQLGSGVGSGSSATPVDPLVAN